MTSKVHSNINIYSSPFGQILNGNWHFPPLNFYSFSIPKVYYFKESEILSEAYGLYMSLEKLTNRLFSKRMQQD